MELQSAISTCQPGDVLVVAKLDRLGRTMEDCVSRVAELLDRGIHVRTLDGRVDTKGLGKMAKMVVGLLAAAAEIERDLLLERTADGLERAVANGVRMGRKRTWDEGLANTVRELREGGAGYGTIATKLDITIGKVGRILSTTAAAA